MILCRYFPTVYFPFSSIHFYLKIITKIYRLRQKLFVSFFDNWLCCIIFVYYLETKRPYNKLYVHLPGQLKLQYPAKVWIRNTTSTFIKTNPLKVKFEMTNYFELLFIFLAFWHFLVVKMFNQLCYSSFVMYSNFYHIQ